MPRVDIAPSPRPSLAVATFAGVVVLAVALIGLGAPLAHAATAGRGGGSNSSASGGGSSHGPAAALVPPGTPGNCASGATCGPTVATMWVKGEREPREIIRPTGHGRCSTLYRTDGAQRVCLDRVDVRER